MFEKQERHLLFHNRLQNSYILWVIDKSWVIQESPDLKPDWFEKIKLFSKRNLNVPLNISVSSIFPRIGSNETRR